MKRPDVKRLIDLAIGLPALAAAAPVIAGLAVLVKLDSNGPAFYTQKRVGKGRRALKLYKLRSMVQGADAKGPGVTAGGDARITRIGRLLRKTKLDELPQLFNVVKGDMSLVGPRPESERYVAHYRPEWEPLLDVRPGITDLGSIVFRDEEALLATAKDRERAYVEAVVPAKLQVALEGLHRSSVLFDLSLIAKTALAVVKKPTAEHPAIAQARRDIERLNEASSAANENG